MTILSPSLEGDEYSLNISIDRLGIRLKRKSWELIKERKKKKSFFERRRKRIVSQEEEGKEIVPRKEEGNNLGFLK